MKQKFTLWAEAVERAALADLHHAAGPDLRDRLGMHLEEVAGDTQHSYRNIERFGFRRTHARANWVPTG